MAGTKENQAMGYVHGFFIESKTIHIKRRTHHGRNKGIIKGQ
jgi:hypothetical protein